MSSPVQPIANSVRQPTIPAARRPRGVTRLAADATGAREEGDHGLDCASVVLDPRLRSCRPCARVKAPGGGSREPGAIARFAATSSTGPQTTIAGLDEYVPGRCNIGKAEIASRRRSGYVGTAATIGLLVALVAIGAPPLAPADRRPACRDRRVRLHPGQAAVLRRIRGPRRLQLRRPRLRRSRSRTSDARRRDQRPGASDRRSRAGSSACGRDRRGPASDLAVAAGAIRVASGRRRRRPMATTPTAGPRARSANATCQPGPPTEVRSPTSRIVTARQQESASRSEGPGLNRPFRAVRVP